MFVVCVAGLRSRFLQMLFLLEARWYLRPCGFRSCFDGFMCGCRGSGLSNRWLLCQNQQSGFLKCSLNMPKLCSFEKDSIHAPTIRKSETLLVSWGFRWIFTQDTHTKTVCGVDFGASQKTGCTFLWIGVTFLLKGWTWWPWPCRIWPRWLWHPWRAQRRPRAVESCWQEGEGKTPPNSNIGKSPNFQSGDTSSNAWVSIVMLEFGKVTTLLLGVEWS